MWISISVLSWCGCVFVRKAKKPKSYTIEFERRETINRNDVGGNKECTDVDLRGTVETRLQEEEELKRNKDEWGDDNRMDD